MLLGFSSEKRVSSDGSRFCHDDHDVVAMGMDDGDVVVMVMVALGDRDPRVLLLAVNHDGLENESVLHELVGGYHDDVVSENENGHWTMSWRSEILMNYFQKMTIQSYWTSCLKTSEPSFWLVFTLTVH